METLRILKAGDVLIYTCIFKDNVVVSSKEMKGFIFLGILMKTMSFGGI